jgi:NitT/TauT family transport system substrate-binding protein
MNKILVLLVSLFVSTSAWAVDQIKLSLDWVPQGEHGGFFQAIAKGYYAEQGIELEIIPGGPSVNTKAMLMADQVEFNIGGSAGALNYAKQDLPFRAVAAFFQKTPQVLMSHPNVGIDHPSDFQGKTIFLSNFGRLSFWGFIKSKYDLSDDQLESYNFNSQPFIDNPQSIQQGYLSSEPFAIKKAAGFEPVVHLLADHGFSAYANTIEASDKLIAENPDLINRFLTASRQGWEDYLNNGNHYLSILTFFF